MRILLVSWYFPPTNTMGALRLGKLASYLDRKNHDLRVLTAENVPESRSLAVGLPDEKVIRTSWFDINAFPTMVSCLLMNAKGLIGARDPEAGEISSHRVATAEVVRSRRSIKDSLNDLYCDVFNFPDRRIGWYPCASRAGRNLMGSWKPDLIYASGPPFTAFLVANRLSRQFRVPLVLEFRDRWSDDPYYPPPGWRQACERFAEQRVVTNAMGIITVSQPWADAYQHRFQIPTIAVTNGFDADDFDPALSQGSPECKHLRIIYTGLIYPGRRDPKALFEALALLKCSRDDLRVEFYGSDPAMVHPLASQVGVDHQVDTFPAVPHREALRLQQKADVLLLMQWNNPKEYGNIPGKLFEYLGARRPILGLGFENGVPAGIIRERSAGFFGNDPDCIAKQLSQWLMTKRRMGHLPELPGSASVGCSRNEQFSKLEGFLERLLQREPRDKVRALTVPLQEQT